MANEKESDFNQNKRPHARNTGEMSFFISFQTCPSCGNRLDVKEFWMSADVGTGAAMSGKCSRCGKRMGFSFWGDHLLKKGSYGNWDEVGPGRTEILIPWQLASEINQLSPLVHDVPSQLDPKQWNINRDRNKRVILCVNELMKLLDGGKDAIADDLLTDEDRKYCEQNPHWFTRTWIETMVHRHRQIVEACINDLPRINLLEARAKNRSSKKNRSAGSTNTSDESNDTEKSPA